ncbi:type I methionyl aminopeptidase [Actinomyces polynesiensis]|uniref:type I methionyl aminopeptidase n=1 Tax=Actinomyces polynesiensis TaxID=1325934 RepID=UPI0005B9558B|nr:type I methionyl aminopeptidase [Actinomyces polynesiensis]
MSRIQLKTREQVRHMRRAGLVVADIHRALREAAVPGVTTRELDGVSARVIAEHGAKSNFLGYFGYPATVCISVNDTVVHGIPDDRVLESGDLVSFDCGAYLEVDGRQWHGDAAFTMIIGGDAAGTQRRRQLNAVTEESMWAALAALASARRLSAVGDAVERVVEEHAGSDGWEAGIIEDYTGHGIGTAMHQDPDVLNYRARGISPRLRKGMVLAVEPMLVGGDIETVTLDDDWTVKTLDGADAAHWEHTIALLDDGVSVLTAVDSGAAGLAPYGVTPISLD